MRIAPDELSEIVADVDYRIEQIWLKIRREAAVQHARSDRSDARVAAAEFAGLRDKAVAIIDPVWAYALDICRAREIRPSDLVPQTTTSLTFICRALVDYGRDLAQAGGEAREVKAAAGRAANAVQKHIQVTAREAALGYAGGKPVFPRALWPDSWLLASARKAVSAGIFVLGMLAGSFATRALEAFWR